jgi:suppressor for copper-sensitivity B
MEDRMKREWRARLSHVLLLLAGISLVGVPTAGWAAASEPGQTDAVSARLVAAVDSLGADLTVALGLEIHLQPGWKTYWRAPGDAGLAPQIDWSGSDGLATASIAWPAPLRFSQFGLETFGYQDEVVLPITIHRSDANHPLLVHAGVDLLVCHDLCVPAHFDLTLSLPLGSAPGSASPSATPSAEAPLIASYSRRVPGDGATAGLTLEAVRSANPGDALEVEASAREPFQAPDLIIESTPPQVFAPPSLSLDHDGHHLTARLAPAAAIGATPSAASASAPASTSLVGSTVTVTLVDGERSLESTVTVTPPATAPTSAVSDLPRPPLPPPNSLAWPMALAFALLGGLILNLMPCVLPVLSMKLLAVVSHGGGDPRLVRAGFLATAGGILASFLALACVMIILKSAGTAVGWGLQFQQPAFLAGMAVVVSLFACNLWGAFEIPLPRIIADAAARPTSAPPNSHSSLIGAFITGVFATLLATPCSAPFLGTAIGFALARGPEDILAVFTMLGIGLALPYLVVATFPRMATALPRPGRWMIGLRRLLGFALAGTALWLLWLLGIRNLTTGLTVATLIVGLTAALALRARLPTRGRRVAVTIAAILALTAVTTPWALDLLAGPSLAAAQTTTPTPGPWRTFDLAALRQEVAAGHRVFVDVTADWCLTCQANQRLVLDRPEIAERLLNPANGVVAMRADWTRPNPEVTRYLAHFGRYGIPFNVIYGPAAPDGLVLPELLSPSVVLAGLEQAAKSPLPEASRSAH